ncbi:DegT/DnrJ/EryC1/StrS family aminotransferase [Hyphobacterium sp.]|uniref:DegT/DnrJ/EryC1/StrS family aminotransferase n=1 Tax=Hyphobacterium sp. TaxID=2004662 RepID=UPI00374A100B
MTEMIPFIDLGAQRDRLRAELNVAVAEVLDSGAFVLGPQVSELESRLAEFAGAPHGIACANGTDAIVLPLLAMGITKGDAVFVPSFTFASSAEVIPWTRATPVFVDVDPLTYNMDPESLKAAVEMVKAEGRLRPACVIAVDLFGQMADYPAIKVICEQHGMKLISDAAQGYGATLDGKHSIEWADALTISFYPAKPLGCYGDGGAVLVKDAEMRDLIKSYRVHGEGKARYEYARIGLNSRLDTIQAAILLVKLDVFAEELTLRQRAADIYNKGLKDAVKTPQLAPGATCTWAQYTIEVDNREAFRSYLSSHGVPTAVYYPIPLHMQPPYASYPVVPGGLPVTMKKCERVVSLPMHADIRSQDQQRVVEAIQAYTAEQAAR